MLRLLPVGLAVGLLVVVPGSAIGLPFAEVSSDPTPGTCLIPAPACLVTWEDGGQPGMGDDRVWIAPEIHATLALGIADIPDGEVRGEEGAIRYPTDARTQTLQLVDSVDDSYAGDRMYYEEYGPSVVFFYVAVPGYENDDSNDRLVIPTIIPVLGPDDAHVYTLVDHESSEAWVGHLTTDILNGCSFAYTLPDDVEHLFCFAVNEPELRDQIRAMAPDIVVGGGLESIRVTTGS